nr:response regulator [Prolixibacteraceae bacterium]
MNSRKYKIFVVDDNQMFVKVLQKYLSDNDQYEVFPFLSARDFLARLDKKPDIVSLDYTLPDGNGKDLLLAIKDVSPSTEVIIVSGQSDINTAIELLKIGAYDYIVKGVDTREKISIAINKIIEKMELKEENTLLRQAVR